MSVRERENRDAGDWAPPEREARPGRDQRRRDEVWQRRTARLTRRWWMRRLINLFILWNFFALAVWLLPYSAQIVQNCVPYVRPYLTLTDLMQNWQMFSPHPDSLDVYLEARLTYTDGHQRSWVFPRLTKMGYVERYRRERFRKLIEVVTHQPGITPVLWPALARYAARQNNPDPRHPPVRVELVTHSRVIPPPGTPIPRDYKAVIAYTTNITARDLQ